MAKHVALVTGGTGAIGTRICELLHHEGYRVIANCHPGDAERSTAALEELAAQGARVELSVFDVTDYEACQQAIREIEKRLGHIDIIVNAAGITRDAKLAALKPDQWSAVLRTNLDGVYNVTSNCIKNMVRRGYGRIINISSVNGERGQIGQTNYSAAKAGVHGFTMALAREVARNGITVNSISPGYIESPMIMAVPQAVRAKIVRQIPVGRFGKPEEIARAVAFLADEKQAYITGTNLSVNGGYHIG